MASMAELKIYLTGGGANADVQQSTGAVVSSVEVLSQSASALTTLTGITIDNALGNTIGDGVLNYSSTGGTVTWTPQAGTTGESVDISVNGTYFIQGGSNGGVVIITVVSASLPTSATANTVTIANLDNKMYIDVTKDQSDVGESIYHAFALQNTGTDQKKEVTIWIDTNTPGQDTISIAAGLAAAGDGASTGIETDTNDELVAPASVTFTAPTTQATGISIGDLSGSGGVTHTRCFWIHLLVPPGVDTEQLDNFFRIGVSAKV